jgi:hypothetical protein
MWRHGLSCLDYFNASRAIPPDKDPPDMRSSLGKKIYDRQKDAHQHTFHRLISGSVFKALTASSDQWFVNSLSAEFDELRKKIYQQYPVPLFRIAPWYRPPRARDQLSKLALDR